MTESAASYRLVFRSRAKRQLDRVPRRDREPISEKIDDPLVNPLPRGCLKLRDDLFRIRVGNWRVFYLIDARRRTVTITAVQRRNERTYRDL